MSLRGLLTLPVEILPYEEGTVDEYNDAAPTFGEPVQVLGYFERTSNNQDNEDTNDRETALSRLLLVLPPETQISYKDRVRISGNTYEIDGTVNEVWHPRQRRVHHKEANLIFVEG
jgi:hypothetical protein